MSKCFTLVVLLLCPLFARGDYAINLVANPDFNAGIEGWQDQGNCGWAGWDNVVGSPLEGALALNCVGYGALTDSVSQCVPLPGSGYFDFSARWTLNGGPPSDVSIRFSTFSTASCSGASIEYVPDTVTTVAGVYWTDWTEEALRNQALQGDARSVLITLEAGPGADVVFDHVVFAHSPIFADGFESTP
jgi:hypothetical protein